MIAYFRESINRNLASLDAGAQLAVGQLLVLGGGVDELETLVEVEDLLVDVLARQAVLGLVQLLDDVVAGGDRRQGELPKLVPEAGPLVEVPGPGVRVGHAAAEAAQDDGALVGRVPAARQGPGLQLRLAVGLQPPHAAAAAVCRCGAPATETGAQRHGGGVAAAADEVLALLAEECLLAPVLGLLPGVEGEGVEVVPPVVVLLLGLRQGQQLDGRGDGEGGWAGRGGLLAGGAGRGGGGAVRGEE